MHRYDGGGKKKYRDEEKFKENYDKIFNNVWPCEECENSQRQGHKLECSQHWRNRESTDSKE